MSYQCSDVHLVFEPFVDFQIVNELPLGRSSYFK